MNWLHYLLEANLYLAVAYGCYWLLFRKQTFYTANRIYLLASTVLCFVIPLIQVGARATVQPTIQTAQTTATVIYTSQTAMTPVVQAPFLTPFKAAQAIYWLVVASMCVWLIIKLYSLLKLVFTSTQQQQPKLTLVYVDDKHTPYSFFNYLFVDKLGNLDEAMMRHEMVHIRQKHSWDIMFIEVLKIINWFNPVVYLLQNSLKALHEFEADRLAAGSQQGADAYVDFLIAQAYHSNGVPFAHQFSNKQLLKSRIMKLYQKRSGKLARLNYLAALPLCAGLLCASTMAFSKDYGWIRIGVKKTESRIAPVDSLARKLRLKVTSNGMTGITNQLEIKGYPGKKMTYTAQTLTAADKKYLLQNFGIGVETTTALATTTSMVLPLPPPPPVESSKLKGSNIPPPPPPTVRSSKTKGRDLPPPPPPSALRKSNKSNKNKQLIPPPPPPVEINKTSDKALKTGKIKNLKDTEFKQATGTVIMGLNAEPNEFVKYTNNEKLLRSQAAYIQVDELKPINIPLNEPVKHGDHWWYLINGKLLDAQALEKRSAAISTNEKLSTLLHAKGTFYHKPQDPATIQKFGKAIGSQGVTEFIDVFWSKL